MRSGSLLVASLLVLLVNTYAGAVVISSDLIHLGDDDLSCLGVPSDDSGVSVDLPFSMASVPSLPICLTIQASAVNCPTPILINGQDVGNISVYPDCDVWGVTEISVDPTVLNIGQNTLTISCVPDCGSPNPYDDIALGTIELDGADTDEDGQCDASDPCTDRDGDGWGQDVGNGIDCPNGSVPDCDDAGTNATDPDVDNICDPGDNCPSEANPGQADLDDDDVGDACDECTDVDGDGWGRDSGIVIDCPNGSTPDCDDEGVNATDPDVDNICDPGDNCPGLANPDQADCQPNGIGDVCDIDGGTSPDQDDDGIPDECEFGPPQPEPDPVCKNRYISFVPDHTDVPTALHVEITASELFPGSVGTAGWVGIPDEDGISRIVAAPEYRVWPEPLVSVGDCMIAPTVTYKVTAAVGPTPEIHSDALIVDTIPQPFPKYWCDVVGEFVVVGESIEGEWTPPNGIVNMNDIMAVLQGFSSASGAAPLTWLDVDPEVPNAIINMTDVQRAVSAFKGEPYPFIDPADCP